VTAPAAPDVEILVIGAGQAGLSAGDHLQRLGLRAERDFLIVDHAPGPGGAWQFRWPSLTLTTVNRVHDLSGMSFAEVLPADAEHARAATVVPEYFARYEERFDLRVHRPASVRVVCDRATPVTCPTETVDGLLHAETVNGATPPGSEHPAPSDGGAAPDGGLAPSRDRHPTQDSEHSGPRKGNSASSDAYATRADSPTPSRSLRAAPGEGRHAASKPHAPDGAQGTPTQVLRVRGLINATGTWEKPFIPYYPGAETFAGRQLHAHDYRTADEFAGKHVVVVGAGISAVQLLDEISQVTTTTWTSRTEPHWREDDFGPEVGRAAVAMVEDRVRRGLPPRSVVSVTGLPVDARIRAARARGALDWHPIFRRIEPRGVRWADDTFQPADVILWATGFRSALDHLAPLRLRGPGGGITMTGRLATRVAADPRIHLLGYGPSASTIGANRAGRAAAVELTTFLGLHKD
jgi:cation diffusion facilitator CzcD-associated flavoprotein CzcO